MSEFKVEIVRIGKVEKHPQADHLELTQVLGGYPTLFSSGDFKEGDLAVYCPIDSLVPVDRKEFAFLHPQPIRKGESDEAWAEKLKKWEAGRDQKVRIKAKKLRGIFSMGLLIPCRLFGGTTWGLKQPPMEGFISVVEGQDVQEYLGIEKYEPDEANRKSRPTGPQGPSGENECCPWKFPEYTDIEGLRKWGNVLEEGEEVLVVEKLHGCFSHNALILMADGSTKTISRVQVGDEIVGVDEHKSVTTTKVVRTFNNGRAAKWLRIEGQRRGAGRGSSFFATVATPEHEFWSQTHNKYISLQDLKPGDEVLLHRTEYDLTPMQKQVLVGKFLGDGSYQRSGQQAAGINWGHKIEHDEYNEWTARALGSIASPWVGDKISGYGTKMRLRHTVFNATIKNFLAPFLREDQKKFVPASAEPLITPLGIAFLYMDQGSLTHAEGQEDRAAFALCDFTQADCEVIQKALLRHGIESVFHTTMNEGNPKEHSRLRVNSDAAERLFLLIAPYVPTCMQYKLPERYRGHTGWLPRQGDAEYKPILVAQKIISITDVTDQTASERYDLETETHNYFANGVLVHNCNARFLFKAGRLWVGSHHKVKSRPHTVTAEEQAAYELFRKRWERKHSLWRLVNKATFGLSSRLWRISDAPRPPKDVPMCNWWQVAIEKDLESILSMLPDVVVYGEVYGRCQDLKYGLDDRLDFRAFDAFDLEKGCYLDYDLFKLRMRLLGIPIMPELYRGPWSDDLRELAEGKTTLGGDHVREGFVVRPIKERRHERMGRVILKLVGQNYLLR